MTIKKLFTIEMTSFDDELISLDDEDIAEFICNTLNDEFYKDGLTFQPVNNEEVE